MTGRVARIARLIVLLAVLPLAGCGKEPLYQQQGYVFGTLVEVSVYGESTARAQRLTGQVFRDFDRMQHTLHAWRPSALTRMNAVLASSPAEGRIDPALVPVIRGATRFYRMSGGLFNPAIGKLIKLWGFESDQAAAVRPDPKQIERLVRAAPKMTDVVIDGDGFYSKNPQVQLDFGGYKGYALDLAAAYLRSQGVKAALLNIGGNIMAIGRHGDRPWHVGIRDPRGPGAIATLDLRDGEAIGTSGDYQRYFMLDGVRYCHVIDPRTGYPAQGVRSVTVVAPPGPLAGALSDAASKPIFISGVKDWRQAARDMQVRDAMLIDRRGEIYLTASMRKRLHFLEKGLIVHEVP